MTLTFAGMLLALVALVVLGTLAQTWMRYGARVLALGDEFASCREHVEMRVALRACAEVAAPGAPLSRASTLAQAAFPAPFPAPARCSIPYRPLDALCAAA